MTALLIDHDDSFTYNLQSWLKPIFENVRVINHRDLSAVEKEILTQKYNLIVLSPGPKNPGDYPHIQDLLSKLPAEQAVYGVCLGLQSMVHNRNGQIAAYTPPLHGKQSTLFVIKPELQDFQNLKVARYHSLICKYDTSQFECEAQSIEDRQPMWLTSKNRKWFGVQFHPESFMTEKADLHLQFLKKWVKQ
jgi:anthranilate synthase/aminodeoxychorismate synthase-like glutamine amidotransferase